METLLTHHKSSPSPVSVLDAVVVTAPQQRDLSKLDHSKQRRKSSISITLDLVNKPRVPSTRRDASSSKVKSEKDPRVDQLTGKKVIFICCGHDGLDSKKFTFEHAKSLGVRSFLVEDGNNTLALSMEKDVVVEKFIRISMIPRPSLVEETITALRVVAEEIGGFDGVCTFWDDSVGFCARVSAALGLPGNSVEAVDIAHDKHRTREAMRAAGLPTPASYLIKSEKDVVKAMETVGVPAILKPMYGASSLAVIKVEKMEDVLSTYKSVAHMLREFYDEGELMGLTFDEEQMATSFEASSLSWLVMEEFLDGEEVDVDLVLQDGECVYRCVVDDWPQIQPWFAEMGNNCPSILSSETQTALIEMARTTAVDAMGLRNGVMHCELKNTTKGPRIIEINPRMGGGPVRRLHLLAFGVDFIEEELFSCLRISGRPRLPEKPQYVSCGEKFFDHSMAVPKEFCQVVEAMGRFPNVLEAASLVVPNEKILGIQDAFPTRCARFVVLADSPLEAQSYAKQLLDMCDIPAVQKCQKIAQSC